MTHVTGIAWFTRTGLNPVLRVEAKAQLNHGDPRHSCTLGVGRWLVSVETESDSVSVTETWPGSLLHFPGWQVVSKCEGASYAPTILKVGDPMSDDTKPCFVCSAPVVRLADTGRIPHYCTDKCRTEARRLRAARSRGRQTAAMYEADRWAFRVQHFRDAA